MKVLFVKGKVLLIVLSFLMLNSCTKETENSSGTTLQNKETTEKEDFVRKTIERPRIKFAVRRPGTNDPDNPDCDCAPNCVIPRCPCKLGICIGGGGGIVLDGETLPDEVSLANDGDLGYAIIEVNTSGKLQFEFEQETCYLDEDIHSTDKLVEIPENYTLPSNVSSELGYTSVEILAGVYYGDFSTNANGIIECDIVTVP
jgi:hypothetical protein